MNDYDIENELGDWDDYDDTESLECDDFDDSMDGDFDTAMRDAGFGTDEDYGDFGGEPNLDW